MFFVFGIARKRASHAPSCADSRSVDSVNAAAPITPTAARIRNLSQLQSRQSNVNGLLKYSQPECTLRNARCRHRDFEQFTFAFLTLHFALQQVGFLPCLLNLRGPHEEIV